MYLKVKLALATLMMVFPFANSSASDIKSVPPTPFRYAWYTYKNVAICIELAKVLPVATPWSYPAATINNSKFPCEWEDSSEPAVDRKFRLHYSRQIYLEMLNSSN